MDEVSVPPRQASPTLAAHTVLIVDDSPATANGLAKVLQTSGLQTAVCLRGQDALDYAQNHPVHAAVVDIHLPDLNGLVVTQQLRQNLGPDTPIIILSGDTSMELLNALPHVGATYFFSKPVNASQLVQRLHESLKIDPVSPH